MTEDEFRKAKAGFEEQYSRNRELNIRAFQKVRDLVEEFLTSELEIRSVR